MLCVSVKRRETDHISAVLLKNIICAFFLLPISVVVWFCFSFVVSNV